MIKSIFKILVISILLISCQESKFEGVWLSMYERQIDSGSEWVSNTDVYYLDFDEELFKSFSRDTTIDFSIDYKKSLIDFQSEQFNIKKIKSDSLEIEKDETTFLVFKPLDLTHKLTISKNKIINFLVNNDFPESKDFEMVDYEGNLVSYLKLDFQNEFSKFNKTQKLRVLLNNRMGKDDGVGYWFVTEIRENYFLFFSADEVLDINIYQILSLSKTKMELKALYESDISGITELKVK